MKKTISVILMLLLLITGCGSNYDAKYEEGLKYLNEGNYEQAIVCFTEAIKIDSKKYPAYVGRGQAYLYSNQPEEAVKDYYSATNLGLGASEVPKEIVNGVVEEYINSYEENKQSKEELLDALKESGFLDDGVIQNIDDALLKIISELIEEFAEEGKSIDALIDYLKELGLNGFASWMRHQAKEEVEHGLKIFDYLIDCNSFVTLKQIRMPEFEFTGILSIFNTVYEHEKCITNSIMTVAKMAEDECDRTTLNFVDWFIEEQVEEEEIVKNIIKRLELFGEDKVALYLMDKELGERDG